jgi:hypothetical protein
MEQKYRPMQSPSSKDDILKYRKRNQSRENKNGGGGATIAENL